MTAQLQVYYSAAWRDVDMFPSEEYPMPMDFQYFALGTFEGGKMPISDKIKLPYTPTNATYFGLTDPKSIPSLLEARFVLDGTVLYQGRIQALKTSLNGLNEAIECVITDKVKELLDELKENTVADLLDPFEYNHDFTVYPTTDGNYLSGIEGINSSSELVRYVYQDYTGIEGINLHRHNEPLGDGNGIQQLQPAFKLNELLDRMMTHNYGSGARTYTSKFTSNTSTTQIPTDKIYVQFPMRYHGFELDERYSEIANNTTSFPMICGYREDVFTQAGGTDYIIDQFTDGWTNRFHNFRVNNRINVKSQEENISGNPFFPFMDSNYSTAAVQRFQWRKTDTEYKRSAGLMCQRSGRYKFYVDTTFDGLTLFATRQHPSAVSYAKAYVQTPNLALTDGEITLNLGVSVNGAFPQLFPLKTWAHSAFADDGDGVKISSSFAVDTSATDIFVDVNQGDIVEIFYMVTSDDALLTLNGTSYDWLEVTDGSEGLFSMHFLIRDTTTTFALNSGEAPAPADFSCEFLNTKFDNQTHTVYCKAAEAYPLSPIPRQYTSSSGVKTTRYERVEFARNCREFIDYSLYDILKDLMSRFNLQLVYDIDGGTFYLDNMYEEYIKSASTTDISGNYDDLQPVEYDYQLATIKDITLMNARGNAVGDIAKGDLPLGSLESLDINTEGTGSISASSFMSVAHGKCHGKIKSQPIDEEIIRILSSLRNSKYEELEVKDYGIRIGFVNDTNETKSIWYPSVAWRNNPNKKKTTSGAKSGVLRVGYNKYENVDMKLPLFKDTINEGTLAKPLVTMGWAVTVDGDTTVSPAAFTTIYDAFYKEYIEKLYGNVNVVAYFTFNSEDLKGINIRNKYDYGDGDALILSINGFDMVTEKSNGRINLLIL